MDLNEMRARYEREEGYSRLNATARDGVDTTSEAVEAMAREIASRAPELTREGRARLAELLRG